VSSLLSPETFAASPERASLDLLEHATEVAIIALCAAHPLINGNPSHPIPIDRLADRVVERAMTLLDALADYRRLARDLERLHSSDPQNDDFDF
jgi:hypothetical protein